jgi:2,4'-dihydroxyacetophenone dioxygenase
MNDLNKPKTPSPYIGTKPQEVIPDIFIQDSFSKDDERLWLPLSPGRWSRTLWLNISQGYWVHLTKVVGGGFLSRHKHPAPVHGFVIKGSWRYLEHDWVAKEGSYLFEPPGEIHTLVVDEDCEEMITLFHNSGALLYCDENGKTIGSTDVFDRVEAARKHFKNVGLGEDFVNQFIRWQKELLISYKLNILQLRIK